MTQDIRKYLTILEEKEGSTKPVELPFNRNKLKPIMSKKTIDVHYDVLTKNYFKKFNKEGDQFAEAGAYLHNIWWLQLKEPESSNLPIGSSKDLILSSFGSIPKFKNEFKSIATTINGNGWCALMKNGTIRQISNHKKVSNIILLLDMWEHSYFLDYEADKSSYVDNFWKIINWDIVDSRILG